MSKSCWQCYSWIQSHELLYGIFEPFWEFLEDIPFRIPKNNFFLYLQCVPKNILIAATITSKVKVFLGDTYYVLAVVKSPLRLKSGWNYLSFYLSVTKLTLQSSKSIKLSPPLPPSSSPTYVALTTNLNTNITYHLNTILTIFSSFLFSCNGNLTTSVVRVYLRLYMHHQNPKTNIKSTFSSIHSLINQLSHQSTFSSINFLINQLSH